MISRREGLNALGLGALGLGLAAPALLAQSAQAQGRAGVWKTAWGAVAQKQANAPTVTNQTIRQKVTLSAGGNGLRVRFSNESSAAPLKVGAASIRLGGAFRPLTFSGSKTAQISPGAPLLSDPVPLSVAPLAELEINLFLPEKTVLESYQRGPQPKGSLISQPGDFTAAAELPSAGENHHLFLSAVEVIGLRRPGLVIYSDTKSAGPGTWPEFFVQQAKGQIAVTNRSMFAGLLSLGNPGDSALARFDRDVLGCTGATHVLIFTGNNDLIQPGALGSNGRPMMNTALALSVEQLTAALAQLVARARAKGLHVIGGTWLPYEGVTIEGYATAEKLAKKDAVNRWIKTPGNFDSVIDFGAALADPSHAPRLLPAYDSGNRFTPSEAGYRAMAATALKQLSTLR